MKMSALLLLMAANAMPALAAPYAVMPEAVTNNAVTLVSDSTGDYLLSFMGLGEKKDYSAIHNKAWALKLDEPTTQWQSLPSVPHIEKISGRLAAIAVGIKSNAYLFGGFTVSADHEEVSTADNYRFSIKDNSYTRIADMPVAVDDTAALVYKDRYIYLLSGWHQHGNVNLVQVYDIKNNTWAQASPLPVPAVFGQAAGIVGNEIVMCDGVTVIPRLNQARTFEASPICLYGKIKADNHLRIDWQLLPHYSQNVVNALPIPAPMAHYRMAAAGEPQSKQIVFMGGSSNPYNYDGIGYNGQPSSPSDLMHRFDLTSHQWHPAEILDTATMDHRGLIIYKHQAILMGGMLSHQSVSNQVIIIPLK
ncbi:galactose oxidase [Shewanella gelidimarina]|uniref:Kelch repeat-containing protein n=1 Tax=Shewanella gelidimarina TaxID=56813 RepID=UPI00200E3BEE|nr:galactose oxidase [Shewanella gelidimarina]MCL1057065.1 galactose oxidase [Shewanella gelidimarina]